MTFTSGLPISVAQAVVDAAYRGVAGKFNVVGALAAAIEEGIDPAELARTHRAIADDMREVVLDEYDRKVHSQRNDAYDKIKRGNRYKGKLRPLLRKNGVIVDSNSAGVFFINEQVLDSEAEHWRRLQYGAGKKGAQSADALVTDVTLGGASIIRLRLDDLPSAGFSLPRGLFFNAQGGGSFTKKGDPAARGFREPSPDGVVNGVGVDAFLPHGEITKLGKPSLSKRAFRTGRRHTRGIAARRFFDAGLDQFAESFPVHYDTLVQRLLGDGRDGVPASAAGDAFKVNMRIPGGSSRIRNLAAPSLRLRR